MFPSESEGRKNNQCLSSSQSGRRNSLFLGFNVLCRPSTDWVRPAHIREGTTQSTDSSNYLI